MMLLGPLASALFILGWGVGVFSKRAFDWALGTLTAALAVDALITGRALRPLRWSSVQCKARLLDFASHCFAFGGIGIMWKHIDKGIGSITDWSTACLVTATTLRMVSRVVAVAHSEDARVQANAIRIVAYTVVMGVATAVTVVLGNSLVAVRVKYGTLRNSTVAECVTHKRPGLLFSDDVSYNTCPTRLWKDIRLNWLFATQLYTLYTITTTLRDVLREQREHRKGRHVLTIGTLTVLQCILLSTAVVVQFDVIEACDEIQYGTVVVLWIVILLSGFRQWYVGQIWAYNDEPGVSTACGERTIEGARADDTLYRARSLPWPLRAKLKL
jgi:hypothetical protein